MTTELFLRDVFELPESVHAGDFKIELSGGFTQTEQRVAEYVVTPQLQEAFGKALSIVRSAVRTSSSHAAYLHGSFGSGKSHFLTVLHAILKNDPAARAKPGLQEVIADHDDWLRSVPGRGFLMVPYHLVGATDIGSALLGGYVNAVRLLHPGQPTPPVYKADALLDDARRQRSFLADDARFAAWLSAGTVSAGSAASVAADDDLDVIGDEAVGAWTASALDRAFGAPAGDPAREALVSALLSGPMSAYGHRAAGDTSAFVPLEDGLSVITRHAQQLGYAGVVLFLDELILWLQAHMANREFVNTQVSNLVKLIESGVAARPVPIVSFISRQRDLSQLVGADVTGADVKNLEAQVQYLAARFDVVSLEDRNLPAIIKERVLKVRPGGRAAVDAAFAMVESTNAVTRDVLLDPAGATGATWQDFKEVYPLSPALLNVLVALSGALQRERTGLKLLQELLFRRRKDMRLGQLIPLGDLWDVLIGGTGEAFTDRLKQESDAAQRFYAKARAFLVAKHGSESDENFMADDRFVKTLLLAALAPDVPALTRLTGPRLAALNHGSIRTRVSTPGAVVVSRMRQLQAEFGELRSDGSEDAPVFSLHLTDLDLEPLLDMVGQADNAGARRVWIKNQLWAALGVKDNEQFVCEREVVWRGTRRTVEVVFANVREGGDLSDSHFSPLTTGNVRVILDYPFDPEGRSPSDDVRRVRDVKPRLNQPATFVWLPHFFSDPRLGQLGRLLKMTHLLERDRLADYAGHLGAEDQVKVRHQLQAQRETLESQLGAVLRQLYGIEALDEANVGAEIYDSHVISLRDGISVRLLGGAGFEVNLLALADAMLASLYPKHPDLDPGGTRKPVTVGELRTLRGWITRAMEDGERRTVLDRGDLALARRIVTPLELGEVHDGPLTVSAEWRRRIEQLAAQHDVHGDLDVDAVRAWIAEAGWTGLDRPVVDLIISTYALLADRAWVHHGTVVSDPPELDRFGTGWSLRAQQLPTLEEFAVARARAADLFGIKAPDVLFARNVARLARDVRREAGAVESAVIGLRQALATHAGALGLERPMGAALAPRVASANEAADLVARLRTARDDTALVTALASARYDSTDHVLGAALHQAGVVLTALDEVQWPLLESVIGFVSRPDGLGRRAERLVADVVTTAAATQFERPLEPVLRGLNTQAVTLIGEAARLASVAVPVPSVAPSSPPPPVPSGPDQVSLTDLGLPSVPSTGGTGPVELVAAAPIPAPLGVTVPVPDGAAGGPASATTGGRRRVRPGGVTAHLESLLGEVAGEISAYRAGHPDMEIEIIWRPVGAAGDGDDSRSVAG